MSEPTLNQPADNSGETAQARSAASAQLAQRARGDNPATSPMGVASPLPETTVKPVDRRTIEGSTPGDFRSPSLTADVTAFAKNPPGPRDPAKQAPLSAKQAPASAPVEYLGAEGSDQN